VIIGIQPIICHQSPPSYNLIGLNRPIAIGCMSKRLYEAISDSTSPSLFVGEKTQLEKRCKEYTDVTIVMRKKVRVYHQETSDLAAHLAKSTGQRTSRYGYEYENTFDASGVTLFKNLPSGRGEFDAKCAEFDKVLLAVKKCPETKAVLGKDEALVHTLGSARHGIVEAGKNAVLIMPRNEIKESYDVTDDAEILDKHAYSIISIPESVFKYKKVESESEEETEESDYESE
jgi:hypothetical protein